MYGVLPALLPRLAADDAAEIGPLGNAADAFGILEEWLAGNGRRLQVSAPSFDCVLLLDRARCRRHEASCLLAESLLDGGQRQEQREAVKLALDRSETITMLHLKLVFDQVD